MKTLVKKKIGNVRAGLMAKGLWTFSPIVIPPVTTFASSPPEIKQVRLQLFQLAPKF